MALGSLHVCPVTYMVTAFLLSGAGGGGAGGFLKQMHGGEGSLRSLSKPGLGFYKYGLVRLQPLIHKAAATHTYIHTYIYIYMYIHYTYIYIYKYINK